MALFMIFYKAKHTQLGGQLNYGHAQLYMGQNTVLLHVRGGVKKNKFFLTDSHPNGHNLIRNIHLGGQN